MNLGITRLYQFGVLREGVKLQRAVLTSEIQSMVIRETCHQVRHVDIAIAAFCTHCESRRNFGSALTINGVRQRNEWGANMRDMILVCVYDNIGANQTPQFTSHVLSEARGCKNTPYSYVEARAPRELAFSPHVDLMGPLELT